MGGRAISSSRRRFAANALWLSGHPGILRVIFNNGLTQNVLLPPPDSLVQERQELKGSCPFLYGWDGERFQMITDLLWNAPLGLQVARGQPLPDGVGKTYCCLANW